MTCPTCGGSRVDPGGLPICRTCGPIPMTPDTTKRAEEWLAQCEKYTPPGATETGAAAIIRALLAEREALTKWRDLALKYDAERMRMRDALTQIAKYPATRADEKSASSLRRLALVGLNPSPPTGEKS